MALGSINKTVFKGSPILDFTSSYDSVYQMYNTQLQFTIYQPWILSLIIEWKQLKCTIQQI